MERLHVSMRLIPGGEELPFEMPHWGTIDELVKIANGYRTRHPGLIVEIREYILKDEILLTVK